MRNTARLILALALASALWAPAAAPAFAAAMAPTPSPAQSIIAQNSLRDPALQRSPAAAAPVGQLTQRLSWAYVLSVFGLLTLGIIGLFWVRRHTAEL